MAISPDFKNAVDSKNVRLTRIMLKDSMVIDPTFREFDELLRYAENVLPDLYDEHDGEHFTNDISLWTKDLLNDQMVNVVYNFSKDRISFLKKLCRYIYTDRVETKEREVFVNEHKPLSKKQVGTGMVAGGAVVAIVGAVTSYSVVAVTGVTIAIAGGIVYYKNK